jgi:streptogramin lyase
MWVATDDTVTRLDPETLEVEATISVNRGRAPRDLPDFITDIAVGEGAVWVAVGVQLPSPGNAVARIDPQTNRVVAYVELFGSASGVAVGEGAVWATVSQPGFLVRIDPATNSEAARVEVAELVDEVTTGAGFVWVGYNDNGARGVAVIDARTEESLRRITLGSGPTGIVVGEGALWVGGWAAGGVEGVVFRIVV